MIEPMFDTVTMERWDALSAQLCLQTMVVTYRFLLSPEVRVAS
jgi:hypothetical protein